ncbi:putative PAS/PAC sensor protein [Hymenobacter roseosalivarius DSM 11622]|uniref:histidine kinase n=1 Tax=Hymenobacter roseosalivarius DSM 11622 TaxID=645990 RepID=A0A1W1W250_9BACT|nr:putative PAS/PAC sensor protein [Hymenobacter roseosalivarius DSM 11622]
MTESLPSTSFTADQSGQVLYISPQWYAYTGMAPGADITAAWPQLIHPDDLPAVAEQYGAALAGGGPWRYEFRLHGADGQYRWFASQGVPEPLADAEAAGRPRQWFGSNLDVDDLKRAQQQLEEKDQLLTSILSSLPASVVTFEGEGLRYGFFNDTFQRRVQGRAMLGRPAGEVFPEAEAQGFLASLRGVLRTGEPYRGRRYPPRPATRARGSRGTCTWTWPTCPCATASSRPTPSSASPLT